MRTIRISTVVLAGLCLALAATSLSAQADSIAIAADGKPRASIVVGQGAGELSRLAATELQKYLRTLSGAEIEIVTDAQSASRPAREAFILVGGPADNKFIQQAADTGLVKFSGLKAEGFIIKTGRLKGRPVVVAGGNDDAGTLYGIYELIERLGATFQLTGDFIPPKRSDLAVPPLDVRMEPAFSRRGFLTEGGYDNVRMFSYEDYVRLFDQMAKMKLNYYQFWWFSYEPWLKYSYRGEPMWMGDVSKKESGYMNWAHGGFGSRTTDDVSIGRQHFKGRRVAPPEFQKVETPDEAFEIAQDLLRRVIRYAKTRGIKVWLAVELASLPPNLARYCEKGSLEGPVAQTAERIFGTVVHPLDPVNREIQVNRFKALAETYPEAEGYFFVFPELYPQLNNEKHRDFFTQQRPAFHELRRLRAPWLDWVFFDPGHTSDLLVDSNIGYFDLFQFLLKKRDEIAPHAKIGVMGIGRGYTLPLLDKMLPKDIPFTDMESGGVWTPAGVPMEYFGGMGERERTLEPRVDDDAHMMGMQFSVRLYSSKDRIFTDGVKHGLTGFAGQLNRPRGTEANSSFLAEAAWSPQLTAEEFYKRHSVRQFGEKAAPDMYRAFMALEDNESYLGYYNYGYSTMNCCGALFEVSQAYEFAQQDNPYDGPNRPGWKAFIVKSPDVINRFEGSIHLLNQALASMKSASAIVAPQGEYELKYMINRTESYRDYMESLITIRKAYISFDHAFKSRPSIPHEQFVAELGKSLSQFELASKQVQAATKKYAEVVDHPSDLGVLYHLNARAVLGFELVQNCMRNVVNYHKGEPLEHVAFERLYQ